MVADNQKYLMIPAVRGGPYIGGKGHLFINQNSPIPLTENENVLNAVSNCNGEALGDYSCIAALCGYNSGIERERMELHHFDIRGNYRRENFAGRLRHSQKDFIDERLTVPYDAAPIMNYLFRWGEHDLSSTMMDNQNFTQQMRGLATNFHTSETLSEVWDPKLGWIKTKSYHKWGDTEQDNCANVQQSLASVVKSNLS
jgi:hypothetical protein